MPEFVNSVTSLGNLSDFGQLPTFLGNICKGVKNFHFSSEIISGQLFTGHTVRELENIHQQFSVPLCLSSRLFLSVSASV